MKHTPSQQKHVPIFISIGSNIEPEKHVRRAVDQLKSSLRHVRVSPIYRTAPVGKTDQPYFLNAVVRGETAKTPEELHKQLKEIEHHLGRERSEDPFEPRTIDLDLLLYGDQIMQTDEFQIPHPDIDTYAHTAVPLADLAPDKRHPESSEPFEVIADRLREEADMNRVTDW